MSSDAQGGGVTQPSGAGAGNPGSASDSVDVAALVNEAVNKALGARLKRIDLEGQITKAVETAIGKLQPAGERAPESTQPPGDNASDGKITMKALQEQVANLQKQLQQQQKAAQEADARARDARARAEFQGKLAARIGADHPMLSTLMDSLYDVKKRVVDQDGRLVMKFIDQWGNEELKSLDEGVSALFDGEFKHLVQSSKASQLPPSGYRAANGQPIGSGQPKPGPKFNPLLAEVASAIGESRPEVGRSLMGVANGESANGTAK